MISSKCNIGIGTIYKYYGNKDDILVDITRELWMSYISEVSSSTDSYNTFCDYIEYLYEKLYYYSKKFNYEVLSRELSSSFREAGRSQHKDAQLYFTNLIERKLHTIYVMEENEVTLISDFISNNLISLITNQNYQFHIFKEVLAKLLVNYKERK